jgi:hypothetical protein
MVLTFGRANAEYSRWINIWMDSHSEAASRATLARPLSLLLARLSTDSGQKTLRIRSPERILFRLVGKEAGPDRSWQVGIPSANFRIARHPGFAFSQEHLLPSMRSDGNQTPANF